MLTGPVRGVLTVMIAAALGSLGACTSEDPAPPPSTTAEGSPSATPSASPSEELPAVGDVFREVRTAALAAESARMEGTVQRQDQTIEIEVEGTAGGGNQEVFLTLEGGGRSEVLTVDEDYWLGGDEEFWTEQTGDAEAGKDMVGKYVPITKADAEELGSFTLRSILTQKLSEPAISAMEASTDPVTVDEVAGTPAFVLAGDDGAQLWVASDGSATLLRVVGPSSDPADLTFTQWDRAQTFSAPPPSSVVETD